MVAAASYEFPPAVFGLPHAPAVPNSPAPNENSYTKRAHPTATQIHGQGLHIMNGKRPLNCRRPKPASRPDQWYSSCSHRTAFQQLAVQRHVLGITKSCQTKKPARRPLGHVSTRLGGPACRPRCALSRKRKQSPSSVPADCSARWHSSPAGIAASAGRWPWRWPRKGLTWPSFT